jgi:glucose-1-phosphatase
MSIKAVLFDMGKVLIRFDFTPAFKKLARHTGKEPHDIADFFIQSGLEVLYDGGKLSSGDFYRRVKRGLGLKMSYTAFKSIWNGIFTPVPGMAGLVQRLKKRGYRLVIVSNTNAMHFDFVKKRYAVLRKFDRHVLSYKERFRKPDPHIYKTAAKACKAAPKQIFYIDDREDLTLAAKELGFHVWTFKNDRPELENRLKALGVL